jgi:uncharacterized membrane protein
LLPAKIAFFVILNSFTVFIALVGISYLQQDFQKGYLAGKAGLFETAWFPAGLYVHSFSAPPALLLVSLLVLFRLERWKRQHRTFGKIALLLIFLAVVPSGWVLSYYAMGGAAGKLIFFVLSSYTAYVACRGYTAARAREIDAHRHWMRELMALLASAVLLRLLLVTFRAGFDFTGDAAYCIAALLSWVPSVVWLKLTYRRSLNS